MAEEIICKNCGLINDYRTKEVVFKDLSEHTEAFCNGCDKHIKYISKGHPSKFHFGKHAGILVSDCTDVSYMQFMVDTADIDKRFRRELELRILEIKQQGSENPNEINNNQNQNTMDITGKLKVKGIIEQVSDKFKKREFILTDDSSQYAQHIPFQLTQDKTGLIDAIAEGSTIKVHFNIRGKEWTSPKGEVKYFGTLEAWRIEVVQNLQVDTGATATATQPATANANQDDLPF